MWTWNVLGVGLKIRRIASGTEWSCLLYTSQLGTQQDRYGAFARAALAGADHNGLRVHMVEVLALL